MINNKDRNTIFEKLKEGFTKIAKEIDNEVYNGDSVETDYVDLALNMVMEAYNNKSTNNPHFYWLGNRRGIIANIIKDLQKNKSDENQSKNIDIFLAKYKENLKRMCLAKRNRRLSQNIFYHGSTNNNIEKFVPRTTSCGDKIPLVYAAYERDFSLTFIFKKGHTHIVNRSYTKGPNAYYKGHTMEDLIMNFDIGGTMYEFLGEEAKSFQVGMAKDNNEVVSKEIVKPTKKIKVISALNELSIHNNYKVFYDDEDGNPKELTAKDLMKKREECIEKLKQQDNKHFELLLRLQKQQENLHQLLKYKQESLQEKAGILSIV